MAREYTSSGSSRLPSPLFYRQPPPMLVRLLCGCNSVPSRGIFSAALNTKS